MALADFCSALLLSQRDMKKKKISEQLSRNETKVIRHVLDKRRYLDFNFAFFESALALQKNSKIKKIKMAAT
jgi:hypothetical protein